MHGPLALEVLHTGFEERLVGITGDVLCDVLAAAFGMTHLTEDASVRTGDAFDRPGGAVRIVAAVIGRLAILLTYCVAIWPLAASARICSSEAMKRPSPWLMAMEWRSPGWQRASHGDLVDTTLVVTKREI